MLPAKGVEMFSEVYVIGVGCINDPCATANSLVGEGGAALWLLVDLGLVYSLYM
ncbi:MAG: hypothetical protein N3D82_00700 [Ignisphaera sp.]|nr:hypothetical protein [Ignisphaera sp.]MCX8167533.1 hypothetical protein [Ignisphaera sp.]MDW8086015.1 hypothetical protein [Ignisphaera sp.]